MRYFMKRKNLTSYSGSSKEVIIPSVLGGGATISGIDSNCFSRNTEITTVQIPQCVKNIRSNAFYGCTSLKEIAILSTSMNYIASDFSSETEGLTVYCQPGFWEYLPNYTTKPLLGINLSSVDMVEGDSAQLTAESKYIYGDVVWSSRNTDVATVTADGLVKAVGAGSTDITAELVYEEVSYRASCSVKVSESSFDLDQHDISMNLGESVALQTRSVGTAGEIVWQSSNAQVASVSSTGVVEALKAGKPVIKAVATIAGRELSAECRVTVNNPTPVLNTSSLSLDMGKSQKIEASINYAKAGEIIWSTNNAGVAKVNNGIVTAVKPGKAKITATVKIGSQTYGKAVCTVKVNTPRLSSKKLTLYRGGTANLQVYNSGNKKVMWKSSSIVSVSKTGKVTAKKAGTAAIVVKTGGVSLTCKVRILNPSISLPDGNNITAGFSKKLSITGNPNNAKVKWKSSNNSIATVSSDGEVKGKKEGKCTIYAALNGVTVSKKINIQSNSWKRNQYRVKRLEDVSFGNWDMQLQKVYFKGDRLVLEYNMLNRTNYTAKKFNYINVTFSSGNGQMITSKAVYNVKASIGSYSTKKVVVSIKAANLSKTLDLKNASWNLVTEYYLDHTSISWDGRNTAYSYEKDY